MKTSDFTLIGHDFTHAKSPTYHDDFICKVCRVRIHNNSNEGLIHEVIGYVDDQNPGEIPYEEIYTLTCEEQQIKNLLE